MQVVDLFAGAGGFSLGAHDAGFTVPLAIDLDKDLTASRAGNFPKSQLLHANIADLDPIAVLRTFKIRKKNVTGVVGGPPCQGFSQIGSRDPNDARNRLVLEFFRFVRAVSPSFFVLENVPGILVSPSRAILDRGLESLGRKYSTVGPFCVDAAKFGAATRRQRVLVIGYHQERVDGLTEKDVRAAQTDADPTVYEAIHDLPGPERASAEDDGEFCAAYTGVPPRGKKGDYARRARKLPPEGLASSAVRARFASGMRTGFKPTAHTAAVRLRFSRVEPGARDDISKCPRLAWDQPCPTLRAGTGADRGSYQSIRPIHPSQHRVITVREAARLQGFPDWFQFHPTQWHSFRMIGNSVSPLLAEIVLRLLHERTEG
jgi:DNA (cytosine-5)-methyltransferase 1